MKPKEICRYTKVPLLAAVEYVNRYALNNEVEMIINAKESSVFAGFVEYSYTVIVYEPYKRPSEIH